MARKNTSLNNGQAPVRGIYFWHHQNLLDSTNREDSNLRYIAEQASKTGLSYFVRIQNISQKLNTLNISDKNELSYVRGVLNSLSEGLDSNISRRKNKGLDYSLLNQARENLIASYNSITESPNNSQKVYISAPLMKSPVIPDIKFAKLDQKPNSAVARMGDRFPSSIIEYPKANFQDRGTHNKDPRRIHYFHRFAKATGVLSLMAAGAIAFSSLLGGCKKPSSDIQNLPETNAPTFVSQDEYLSLSNKLFMAESNISQLSISYSNQAVQLESSAKSNSVLLAENKEMIEKAETISEENKMLSEENKLLSYRLNLQSKLIDLDSKISNLEKKVTSNDSDVSETYTPDELITSQDLPYVDSAVITSVEKGKVLYGQNKKNFGKIGNLGLKYRVHSLDEGSRSSRENLVDAFDSAKDTGSSLLATLTLTSGNNEYASSRLNDGKFTGKEFGNNFVDFIKRATIVSDTDSYKGGNVLTKVITWPSRTIIGGVNLVTATANLPTLGMADNIINPAFGTFSYAVETTKHVSESVLNIPRPAFKVFPEKSENFANNAWDWPSVMAPQFISNVLRGEGYSNAEDMFASFDEKGNMVIPEFLAAAWLTYNTAENLNDDGGSSSTGGDNTGPGAGHSTGGEVGSPAGVPR